MTPPLDSMPLNESQWQQVQALLRELDERQTLWLSGYLAATPQPQAAASPAKQGPRVLIVHGGETGNSEAVAQQLAQTARADGIAVDVQDLAQFRLRQLSKRQHALFICSTHGDGDPPEPAMPFFEALMAETAPALKSLHFSVLALGDSTYEYFCTAGEQLDQRLEALGATRLHPRQDCDVDFEQPAEQWSSAVLKTLPRETEAEAQPQAPAAATGKAADYSKKNPLAVEVLENLNLSDPQRQAPIHHLELALDDGELSLSPGDAVGVLADNPPARVAAVLDCCQLSGEAPVTVDKQSMPLVQALREHRDLTIATTRFLTFWAELSDNAALQEKAQAATREQRQFLKQVQLLDLLNQAPATPDPQALVDALRPLQPRLYDLANSLNVIDDELHLSVKAFHYPFANRMETGIASQYLLAQGPGDNLRIYPHRNARFHLPEDDNTPVILIGEGTGIAPYRAFLQEMDHRQSPANSWLVFAEEQFEQDFLYQQELQQAHRQGTLNKVDTVFYQDAPGDTLATPLLRQADTVKDWIEQGAHLYFCGDKQRLADCEKALSEALGDDLWKPLGKAKRIHRNLY